MDSPKPPPNAKSHASLEVSQHGIYKLFVKRPERYKLGFPEKALLLESISRMARFLRDTFNLGPRLFLVIIIAKTFWSLESALKLWASGRFLSAMEDGLVRGKPDTFAIIHTGCVQLATVIVSGILKWSYDRADSKLRHRAFYSTQERLMKATISMDLATSQEGNPNTVNADDTWYAFNNVLYAGSTIVEAMGQLAFLYSQFTTQSGGAFFLLLCLMQPLFEEVVRPTLWGKRFIAYAVNQSWLHMQSLTSMTAPQFRAEVLGGDLVEFILKEYRTAREALGDISDANPQDTYGFVSKNVSASIAASVVGDLPMIYHGVNAIVNPSQFSLAQISVLQQSSSLIQTTLWKLVYTTSSLKRASETIKSLEELQNVKNKLKDAEDALEYPQLRETENEGMEFELRDVSFTYPGEKAKVALKNVNLKIKAGQLVVFVGENGGGKSSIIKLLCRLYDVTSGQILVDGHDIKSYKVNDLRKATATLTQEHRLYPLSIRANIGLGNTEFMEDEAVVREAARLGGALQFIEKLDGGLEKNLTPMRSMISGDMVGLEDDDPLQLEFKEAEKNSEVSGGEMQRLVAARTFMRFTTGKITFVAVDEPSSAIDPQGEFELFRRLRETRKGKTMVFVTHRFGHLTKFADLIVCIKDGSVSEQGTHEELLKLEGEYSKLYNVQARAFTSGEDESTKH